MISVDVPYCSEPAPLYQEALSYPNPDKQPFVLTIPGMKEIELRQGENITTEQFWMRILIEYSETETPSGMGISLVTIYGEQEHPSRGIVNLVEDGKGNYALLTAPHVLRGMENFSSTLNIAFPNSYYVFKIPATSIKEKVIIGKPNDIETEVLMIYLESILSREDYNYLLALVMTGAVKPYYLPDKNTHPPKYLELELPLGYGKIIIEVGDSLEHSEGTFQIPPIEGFEVCAGMSGSPVTDHGKVFGIVSAVTNELELRKRGKEGPLPGIIVDPYPECSYGDTIITKTRGQIHAIGSGPGETDKTRGQMLREGNSRIRVQRASWKRRLNNHN